MEIFEEIMQKRKEKIINWIKNPYNFIFLLILVFAIGVRLYYFFLVKNQPVWWDESEYLNMAKSWAFNLEYQFDPVRPVLFSLIMALFFKIANTEFLPRVFILLLSMISIAGVYYLGKEIYNKKIGLLASFLMSVFYLHLFFTYRILVDLASLSFFMFAALLFYKYSKDNSKKKLLYWASALIAIGTLFKITTALLLFAFLIYLLITERLNFLKKKEIWIAAFIFLLILSPYFIWGYLEFNGFVITQAFSRNAPKSFFGGFTILKNYLILFPSYFSWPLLIAFICGLIMMYKLFLGFDILIKEKDKKLKRDLYLLLILLIPLILLSFLTDHNENRYILNVFPAIFIISGFFIIKSYNLIKRKNKLFAIALLIFLLGFITFFQLQSADSLIKNKQNSYLEIKQAGLWLKENSEVSDVIATHSLHQIKYYSERETTSFKTKEEFESIRASKNLRYYVISLIQKSPDWTYSYPEENNLTVVQAYFADQNNQQPILIIYKF